MKLNIKSLFAISSVLFSTLVFSSSAIASNASAAIDKADAARLEAKKLGFEWSTTSILINRAKEAEKNGDSALAEKLANQALAEANNAIKQSEFAEKNWQESEPN